MTERFPISQNKLPSPTPCAMWHPVAGLVVSQLTCVLPENVADLDAERNNRQYHLPRKLRDDSIYLAFYPKRLPISSLVKCLVLTPDEIYDRIRPIQREGQLGEGGVDYMLLPDLITQWANLEDALVSIFRSLMNQHRDNTKFPTISWPHLPEHWGYRASHKDREVAFGCVKRSHRAFNALMACVSFSLSLWLTENEYLCFDNAWNMLASGQNPIPRAFLDLLQLSVICNFESGLRAGGFLFPFSTRWGPWMRYFARARVPLYFIWGHPDDYTFTVDDPAFKKEYFPPSETIARAKEKVLRYSNTILPLRETSSQSSVFLPPPLSQATTSSVAQDTPALPTIDPRTRVEPGSGQRRGESWEEFKARMENARDVSERKETARERQSRLSKQQHADTKGVSQSSKVFTWESDFGDPPFYRRTRVSHKDDDAQRLYYEVRPYQRFYWSHCNEWDLVSHVAPPAGEVPPGPYEDDSDEEDWLGESRYPVFEANTSSGEVGNSVEGVLASAVADIGVLPDVNELVTITTLPLDVYIRDRHGYRYNPTRAAFHTRFHSSSRSYSPSNAEKVKKALLYPREEITHEIGVSLCDFFNTAANEHAQYNHLPNLWDVTADLRSNQWSVRVFRFKEGDKIIYILRPSPNNDNSWYVAVKSPTAVLLACRRNWVNKLEIARGFLELGIPFRTVVEAASPPPTYKLEQSRGLGLRPCHHKFVLSDYNEYKLRRHDILTSSLGRAVLLRGGLVGRMASEIVPVARVFDGPLLCDEVVARLEGIYFVDDQVTPEILDCVSGVYHTKSDKGDSVTHTSFWPKQNTFMMTGLFSDQWTPRAEEWYREVLGNLEAGNINPRKAYDWKNSTKYFKSDTKAWVKGSEKIAAEYLQCSRRAN